MSSAIRTLLIFSAKDFNSFFEDEEDEAEEEIEDEPANTKAMQLMMKFFEELSRVEAVGRLQNVGYPGIPADYEPAMNRLGAGEAGETQFLNGIPKTPPPRDNGCYLRGPGGII